MVWETGTPLLEITVKPFAAAKAGVVTETKQVSNPVYKGPVMLYPRSFLDLYFKGGLNENTSGKQLLKG